MRHIAMTLALCAVLRAGAEDAIRQDISVDISQEAWIGGAREDGPINKGNWMDLPGWGIVLRSDARLRIEFPRGLELSLSPRVAWQEREGGLGPGSWSAREGSTKDPSLELYRAEASFALPDLGIRASFGKMRPEFGANYIEPLSVINRRGRDAQDEGLWMGGLSFAWMDFSLEAYYRADAEPCAIAAVSALLGPNELGLVFRCDEGSNLGAWFRGQIGEGLVPYAEYMLHENTRYLDIKGLPERDKSWASDILAGFGFSPAELNLSFYLEYRYREGGYAKEDWDAARAIVSSADIPAARAAEAGIASDLPRLQTAIHALGLYARNASDIAERFSWKAFVAYSYPDGLFASVGGSARIVDQCSIELDSSLAASLGGGDPGSEIAFWPYQWRCSLRAHWKLEARE